jgi:hypothetical protein
LIEVIKNIGMTHLQCEQFLRLIAVTVLIDIVKQEQLLLHAVQQPGTDPNAGQIKMQALPLASK